MTGPEFSGVDFDLLADYVGGALTGTPDEAAVAALIAGDSAWRAAHDELAGAMASVGAELGALGAVSEPMPPEVVRRLDAGFASAASDTALTDPELAAPAAPAVVASGAGVAPGRHLSAVPDDDVDRGVGGRRPADRRRRLRWAAPIAAAAGVIAFAGLGVNYLTDRSQSNLDSAGSSAAGSTQKRAEARPQKPMVAMEDSGVVGDQQIVATGRDYQSSTLASAPAQLKAAPASTLDRAGPVEQYATPEAPLVRLRPAEALAACLAAISQENAAGPISAPVVDFARFAGQPAVIVRFTAANGGWVWAAGPDCGLPASGAAKLASVKVS